MNSDATMVTKASLKFSVMDGIKKGAWHMALPLFQERRISARKRLTGLLPGRLVTVDGTDINCKPKDVSEHGLGITSKNILKIDDKLILKTKDKEIELKVMWAQPGFGKRDEFRYGLCSSDNTHLEELFIESGCLI